MDMSIFSKNADKAHGSNSSIDQIDRIDQIVEDTAIIPPQKKKVVFYNDDYTTMDFVVEVLISIFNKSKEDATKIMQTVHRDGFSVVGTYTYDIAVSRVEITKNIAKQNGFPLRVEIEQSE
jgi:ATP-dependent Clp protease adaptor protein ClpS